MKRSTVRQLGVLAGIVLLVALVLSLALPGMAVAKQRIPASNFTPDVAAPQTTDNAASYAGPVFVLVFTAFDSESGVAATYYRIDGRAWKAGSAVTIRPTIRHKGGLPAGLHTIEYYSVDMSDNVEPTNSCEVTL